MGIPWALFQDASEAQPRPHTFALHHRATNTFPAPDAPVPLEDADWRSLGAPPRSRASTLTRFGGVPRGPGAPCLPTHRYPRGLGTGWRGGPPWETHAEHRHGSASWRRPGARPARGTRAAAAPTLRAPSGGRRRRMTQQSPARTPQPRSWGETRAPSAPAPNLARCSSSVGTAALPAQRQWVWAPLVSSPPSPPPPSHAPPPAPRGRARVARCRHFRGAGGRLRKPRWSEAWCGETQCWLGGAACTTVELRKRG